MGNEKKSRLPDDFRITESMRAWAQQKMPMVDLESATEEFCDHFWGNGKTMLNWEFTWRNWIRRVPKFSRHPEIFTPKALPLQTKIAAPILARDHPLFRGIKKAE